MVGFYLVDFGLHMPFYCRVKWRHATNRQTDTHTHRASFYNASSYGGRSIIMHALLKALCMYVQGSPWQPLSPTKLVGFAQI